VDVAFGSHQYPLTFLFPVKEEEEAAGSEEPPPAEVELAMLGPAQKDSPHTLKK
jgi:hypothetical protein